MAHFVITASELVVAVGVIIGAARRWVWKPVREASQELRALLRSLVDNTARIRRLSVELGRLSAAIVETHRIMLMRIDRIEGRVHTIEATVAAIGPPPSDHTEEDK